MRLADFNPQNVGSICVLDVAAVGSPCGVSHVDGIGGPVGPLAGLKIENAHGLGKLLEIESRQVAAVGRPARTEQAFGTGNSGDLPGGEIDDSDVRFFLCAGFSGGKY